MKTHIVTYGAYYYAELISSKPFDWATATLQYRTAVGDLFVPSNSVRTFPTRLEAYRWIFFNIKDLHSSWYSRRRICYSYTKLTRIMRKHFIEDFI